jgi:tRNA dimethylallyltransferase
VAVIGIVGPTASGKTALSLELAEALGGADSVEIVSADAMQLYRGMDVGTAKIFPAERRGIVHRQIDVLDVLDEASVAAYQRSARADVDAILAAGKTPVAVGGSGLYVSGLLDRLDFPGRDRRIRAELESLLEKEGPGPLLEELARKDPQAYEAMDLANTRRLVRALEAIRVTGRPYTPRFPRHTAHYPDVRLFGAFRGSDVLNAAIDRRAKEMMASGLVEETRELMGRGLADSPTAGKATGYAEAMAVIEGRMRIEEAVESMCLATRRLAKKQTKWFRADPRIEWLDLSGGDVPRAVGEILRALEAT